MITERGARLSDADDATFRLLADQLPYCLWTADPEGRADFINRHGLSFHGLTFDQLRGRLAERVHPDDRGEFSRARTEGLTAGQEWSVRARVLRSDGAFLLHEVRSSPVRDREGRIVRWLGTLQNVETEARLSEQVREEQRRLDAIAGAAPAMLYTFRRAPDGGLSFPYASPATLTLFGLTPADLERDAAPAFGRIPEPDRSRVFSGIEASARAVAAWEDQFRFLHPSRGELWLEGRSVPTVEPDGSIIWHGVISEITDRKRLERQVRLRSDTIERSPTGHAVFTRSGRFVDVNPAFARMWGYDRPQDVLPLSPVMLCMDTGVPAQCMATVDQQGQCVSEFAGRRRDGTPFEVRMQITRSIAEDGGEIFIASASDVTEERKSQTLIRQWADAFQNTSWGIAIGLPGKETLLACNAAYAALLRRPQEEIPNLPILSIYAEEDHPRVKAGIAEADRVGRSQIEGRVRRADGTLLEVQVGLVSVKAEDGSVRYRVATVQDISERKAAEASLRESENRLRLFIEHAPAALAMFDREMRYLAASNRWLADFQLPASILGQCHYDLFPEIPERWRDIHRRAFAGEVLRAESDEFVRDNGAAYYLRWEVRPWYAADGTVGGLLIYSEDITSSLAAQSALSESIARFRQLAESIREVFWLSDVAKHEIIYLSPGYEEIWGQKIETLRENPLQWLDAIHADDRERIRGAMARQAEGAYDEEYRVVRPDGSVRWVRDQAFPVRNEQGDVVRIAGVAEDITERRQLEQQVRQTQKMESIGLLAGGVAHDFNNWLTVIAGSCELLQENVEGNPESLELMGEILRATERATGLTRQLLAFSRQEVIEPRVLDLNGIIADTEKMLRRLLGEDVLLETSLAPQLDPVRVDPGQWTQVLMNLAVNARDAMPRGGHLTMETRTADLDAEFVRTRPALRAGRHVILSLSDTGLGMPPEVRARIFEPFFTTKEQGRGTGLGLAVVHGIVSQSGGTIEVYSETGKGTTFRIYLPSTFRSPESALPHAQGAPVAGTETVLVVEDEESIRRLTTQALRRHGYRVLQASDGEDALALLHRYGGEVDILVTDVVMPRMDGRTLAEQMHTLMPGLKVLYTSGYTDDAVVRHGILQAEVAFLSKPYTPSTLLRKIRQVLDG
ncbi:MAG: PAS domain S-box protein [Gemmatimonadales bacterium]